MRDSQLLNILEETRAASEAPAATGAVAHHEQVVFQAVLGVLYLGDDTPPGGSLGLHCRLTCSIDLIAKAFFRGHMSGVTLLLVTMCVGMAFLSACAQTPTAVPILSPGKIQTRAADGAEMIQVLAGEFLMGSTDADRKAGVDEKPAHTLSLDAFWIDRTEVTNAQYVRFLNALGGHAGACGGHDCVETKVEDKYGHILRQEGRYVVERGFEDHPATEVTWYGAQAYCEWAGARLPTEAEWEKAARGGDGRPYPWGSDAPDCDKAQYGDCDGATVPAGSRPAGASPYGVLDMAGNVWEWVADWYDEVYYERSPTQNPPGPISGERKVFRGGSWGYPPTFIRTSDRARNRPSYAGFNVGFRCASGDDRLGVLVLQRERASRIGYRTPKW